MKAWQRKIMATCSGIAIAALSNACATKPPPAGAEIRQQALGDIDLNRPWSAAAMAEPVTDDWLSLFHDSELDALVREALVNNPDLRVAAARVEEAQQYLALAKAALRPSVAIVGTGGLKSGGGDISSALQGILLTASWELDLWGRLRYARNATRQAYASAQADFAFARQSLAASTAKAWFTATQLSLHAAIVAEMVQSSKQLKSLAEQREVTGAGTTTETVLASASVRMLEDTQQQITLARGQALRALELLVGRYPAAQINTRGTLSAMPGPIPVGIPLQMLERRPDIIAAERRVAVAFNRVGEAKAAYFPRITLNANAGAFSSEILQLKPDFENPTAGVGGRLFAPIYQGGSIKAQVEIRTAEQKQAVAEYGRLALRALGDVENSLAADSTLAARVLLLNQALGDQLHALELTQKNFRIGRADMRAVEQQRLNVSSARIALLNVQSDQLAARVNLHLALGGSFESPERQSKAE